MDGVGRNVMSSLWMPPCAHNLLWVTLLARDSAERDFAPTFSSLSDATPAPAHRGSKEGSGLTGSVYARPDPRDEQDTGSDDPMSASDREAARLTPRGSQKKGAQHRRLPALC